MGATGAAVFTGGVFAVDTTDADGATTGALADALGVGTISGAVAVGGGGNGSDSLGGVVAFALTSFEPMIRTAATTSKTTATALAPTINAIRRFFFCDETLPVSHALAVTRPPSSRTAAV